MMFHGNILRMIIDVVQRIFMLWLMPPPQKCGILSPYILSLVSVRRSQFGDVCWRLRVGFIQFICQSIPSQLNYLMIGIDGNAALSIILVAL